MIDAQRFGPAAAAHLAYARGLPFTAGMDAVEARRRDGSWERVPDEWVETLNTVLHRARDKKDRDRVRTFALDLLPELSQTSRPNVLTASISRLLPWLLDQKELASEVDRFVTATLAGALPGHAGLLATALDGAARTGDSAAPWPPPLVALAEWLLQNGAAELRRGEHAFLVRRIVLQGDRGACEWVGLALQYGLREGTFTNFWTTEADERLWDVVERQLTTENEYLAIEPVRLAGDRMHPVPLPMKGAAHPRCRDAILRSLMRGDLPPATMERLWSHLFTSSVPLLPDAIVTSGDALACSRSAFHAVRKNPGCNGPWIEFATSEILRVFGEPRLSSYEIGRTLIASAGCAALATGILRGVHRYVLNSPSAEEPLLHALLAPQDDVSEVTRVSAALRVLEERPPPRAPEDVSEYLRRLRTDLARVVGYPWARPIYGVPFDELLGGARTVEFCELADEDKVLIEGGAWRLDLESLAGIARGAGHRGYEQVLKLATLFAIHETIHLAQGIGAKVAVDRLRSTGAEPTLLQIDLSADHAAALLACQVFPQWAVAELKGLLGEGGFPASRWHTMAARSRKALRRIGLRLDSLIRRTHPALAAKLNDGYAWADFGPAGGSFLVMSSGPPVALLATTRLSQEDAILLGGAADRAAMGREALTTLDACLARLVDQGVTA